MVGGAQDTKWITPYPPELQCVVSHGSAVRTSLNTEVKDGELVTPSTVLICLYFIG